MNTSQSIYFQNHAFFYGGTNFASVGLWKSDGTAAGTVPVWTQVGFSIKEINLTPSGRLIMNARDGKAGEEPWISDGTLAGTALLKDVFPGGVTEVKYGGGTTFDPHDSLHERVIRVGDEFLFTAFSSTDAGRELTVGIGLALREAVAA